MFYGKVVLYSQNSSVPSYTKKEKKNDNETLRWKEKVSI